MKRSFPVIVLLLWALSLPAEEPPHLSKKLLGEAKEVCEILVEEVRVRDDSEGRYKMKLVNLRARVLKAARTSAGLKKGDTLYLLYVHTYDKIPGPSPVPVLKEGGRYRAWLNPLKGEAVPEDRLLKDWDGRNGYGPPALGKSFLLID
ncbi:MAG TPA: hypothetical protein ENN21_00480 [Spirochaetes bacterium]|nr:hypothetical protein [Spirochaetota bacterium]